MRSRVLVSARREKIVLSGHREGGGFMDDRGEEASSGGAPGPAAAAALALASEARLEGEAVVEGAVLHLEVWAEAGCAFQTYGPVPVSSRHGLGWRDMAWHSADMACASPTVSRTGGPGLSPLLSPMTQVIGYI